MRPFEIRSRRRRWPFSVRTVPERAASRGPISGPGPCCRGRCAIERYGASRSDRSTPDPPGRGGSSARRPWRLPQALGASRTSRWRLSGCRGRPELGSDAGRAGARVLPSLAGRQRQIAGSLSGGEQQMLSVARSIVGAPTLLHRRRALARAGPAPRRRGLRRASTVLGRPA